MKQFQQCSAFGGIQRRVWGILAASVVATAGVMLAAAPAQAQQGKLKVGLMLPYTGTYAALGNSITNAFKLAIPFFYWRSTEHGKTGLRTSPWGSVYLEDCRVPEESRVGPEGERVSSEDLRFAPRPRHVHSGAARRRSRGGRCGRGADRRRGRSAHGFHRHRLDDEFPIRHEEREAPTVERLEGLAHRGAVRGGDHERGVGSVVPKVRASCHFHGGRGHALLRDVFSGSCGEALERGVHRVE